MIFLQDSIQVHFAASGAFGLFMMSLESAFFTTRPAPLPPQVLLHVRFFYTNRAPSDWSILRYPKDKDLFKKEIPWRSTLVTSQDQ